MLVTCFAGIIWVGFSLQNGNHPVTDLSFCPVKELTGYPCPACGSTRSVTALIRGDIARAWYWNPFGFIILIIMMVSPVWVLMDLIKKKSSFHTFYLRMESALQYKWISIPAILLVLSNWIWNLIKHV
jgi:hypothetical protein